MNKNTNTDERSFPPVLTIFESIIVTLCLSASVFLFYISLRDDFFNGLPVVLPEKFHNEDFINALVLFVLAVIYIFVRIINFYLFAKPLRKLQRAAGHAAGVLIGGEPGADGPDAADYDAAGRDAALKAEYTARVDAVMEDLAKGESAVLKLSDLSKTNSRLGKEVQTGVRSFSDAAKHMVQNISVIENATNQFSVNIEKYYLSVREMLMGAFPEANAANAESGAEAFGETGANPAGSAVKAPLNAQAPEFLDKLRGEAGSVAVKLRLCADIIAENVSRASRLSLNAAAECAKIGSAARGFAYVAEDVRENAEYVRTALPIIRDALSGAEAQSALIESCAGVEPEDSSGGFDREAWEYEYTWIHEQLGALQSAIKSVRTALAGDFELRRLDENHFIPANDNNIEIANQIKALRASIDSVKKKLESV